INIGSGDIQFIAGTKGCGSECSDLSDGQTRSFTLDNQVQINTGGDVVIKAADGISIGGVIGNLSSPNSISLQAGNTVKLGSTSSIAAGKNSENNSPTIYISAGDASLSAEAGEQLAAPHITLNNPLTGNLL